MILKCAACGGDMEISGGIPENVTIECPHCGEHVRINKPHRLEVPTNPNMPRFVPDDGLPDQTPVRRRPDLHIRRPAPVTPAPATPAMPPPRQNPRTAKKKNGGSGDWVIYALLAVVVAGLGIYWMRKSNTAPNEDLDVSAQSESSVRTDADAEQEKLRAERRAREEAEREKRRAEKAKRDAERERERQEMAEKANRERELREIVSKAEMRFSGATSVFASDFPAGKRPFDFAEDGIIIVADENYIGGRSLYRLTVEGKRLKDIQKVSQRDGSEDVSPDDFMRMVTNKIVLAKLESGPVWICGNTKSSERIDVPDSSGVYSPLSDFMGGSLPVLNALHVAPPAIKYRVTLKARNGSGEIKIGVVEKEMDLQTIRSKVREQLTDRKLKSSGSGIKPPAMKKIKRTVVFYDGEKIVKGMTGVTKVPRSFTFFGTARNHDNKAHVEDIIAQARRKWESLREEAERQDRRELEIEAENQRRMDEYRRKVDTALRNSKATEGEVDAELRLYRLLIERSRTKLPKE